MDGRVGWERRGKQEKRREGKLPWYVKMKEKLLNKKNKKVYDLRIKEGTPLSDTK